MFARDICNAMGIVWQFNNFFTGHKRHSVVVGRAARTWTCAGALKSVWYRSCMAGLQQMAHLLFWNVNNIIRALDKFATNSHDSDMRLLQLVSYRIHDARCIMSIIFLAAYISHYRSSLRNATGYGGWPFCRCNSPYNRQLARLRRWRWQLIHRHKQNRTTLNSETHIKLTQCLQMAEFSQRNDEFVAVFQSVSHRLDVRGLSSCAEQMRQPEQLFKKLTTTVTTKVKSSCIAILIRDV